MDNNNIDSLFKKALREERHEPPAYIWERIDLRMAERRNRKIITWWRGIAAAVLLGSCIWLWQLQSKTAEDLYVMQNTLSAPFESFQADIPPINSSVDSSNIVFKNTEIPVATNSNWQKESCNPLPIISPASVLSLQTSGELRHASPVGDIKTSHIRSVFIPLVNKNALENHREYEALLAMATSIPEKQKKDLRMELSGHFTPAYSSGNYSSDLISPRGYSYSQSQMKGMMNVGGGMKLAISTGKRLSVQTGLSYSRMGQRTSESGGITPVFLHSLKNADKYVTTPLGNVKSRTHTIGYRSNEAVALEKMGYIDQSIEQVFGSLEIPLLVRYRLNDNKIRFSIAGGFCSNVIVSNKVYLETENNRELAGSTEDIRNFNMSTDLSLGVEYPITSKIKIMVEPGFKYYLQSISRNDAIDYKPYVFSFSTGIGFEF